MEIGQARLKVTLFIASCTNNRADGRGKISEIQRLTMSRALVRSEVFQHIIMKMETHYSIRLIVASLLACLAGGGLRDNHKR